LLESLDLLVGQGQLLGRDRGVEVIKLRRADDRRSDAGLVEEPGERDLRGRNTARLRHLGSPLDDIEVDLGLVEGVREGIGLRAFGHTIPRPCAAAGEHAPGQRTPRDHADTLVDALRDHLALLLAVDQVVVVLHRDEAGARGGLSLGELPREHAARADVARFPGLDHILQRVHRLLDRSPRIPPVDLVEVDVVELQPRERSVDRGQNMLAREPLAVLPGHRAAVDLGREDVLLAHAEELSQQASRDHLALAAVVDVGGVEERNPAIDRPAENRLRLALVKRPRAALVLAVAHHPEAHPGDAQAGVAEVYVVHPDLLVARGLRHIATIPAPRGRGRHRFYSS
jgi:hypothetical protein